MHTIERLIIGLAALCATNQAALTYPAQEVNIGWSNTVRNLNITGMSFGFYVVKDEWTRETVVVTGPDGSEQLVEVDVRRILEIRLVEVSAVTFPAYDATDAGLRSMCAAVRAAVHGDTPAATRGTTDLPAPTSGEDREPGETTRGEIDDEPAAATRSDEVLYLRMRARAKRDGLPFDFEG